MSALENTAYGIAIVSLLGIAGLNSVSINAENDRVQQTPDLLKANYGLELVSMNKGPSSFLNSAQYEEFVVKNESGEAKSCDALSLDELKAKVPLSNCSDTTVIESIEAK